MIMKIGLCLILVFVGLTVAVLFSSCCLFTVNKPLPPNLWVD